MKTFTATFVLPDGQSATATAQFETLPGESAIRWEGTYEALQARLFRISLPPYGYAGTFEDWMKWFATRTGSTLTFNEEGDWTVHDE